MFNLRACPRCRGDLYAGEDIYGVYLSCVQCGRYFPFAEVPARVGRPTPDTQPAGPPERVELELAA